jgi:hypothetical protein
MNLHRRTLWMRLHVMTPGFSSASLGMSAKDEKHQPAFHSSRCEGGWLSLTRDIICMITVKSAANSPPICLEERIILDAIADWTVNLRLVNVVVSANRLLEVFEPISVAR